MGEIYSAVELYDIEVSVTANGIDLGLGRKRTSVPCYVDSGTNRTVVSREAIEGVRTVRTSETATLARRAWPIHHVWMKLSARGCQPRIVQVAVSSEIVEAADVDDALVIIGQDYLQRDKVGLRFDEVLELHGLRGATRAPAPADRIAARKRVVSR